MPPSKIEAERLKRLRALLESRYGKARIIDSSDPTSSGEQLWLMRSGRRQVGFAWIPPRSDKDIREQLVHGVVVEKDGFAIIGSLTVEPGPVTPTVLRGIRSGDLLRKVVDALTRRVSVPAGASELLKALSITAPEYRSIAEAQVPGKRGRPALSDKRLFEITKAYLDAASRFGVHGARVAVAEREGVDAALVGSWLQKARVKGFLAPTTPGRASAIPGRRFEELRRRKGNK